VQRKMAVLSKMSFDTDVHQMAHALVSRGIFGAVYLTLSELPLLPAHCCLTSSGSESSSST